MAPSLYVLAAPGLYVLAAPGLYVLAAPVPGPTPAKIKNKCSKMYFNSVS